MDNKATGISFRAKIILFGIVLVGVVGIPFLVIEAPRPWRALDQMIAQGFGVISGFDGGINHDDLARLNRFALQAPTDDENNKDYMVWSFNLLLEGNTLPPAEQVLATLRENDAAPDDFDYARLSAAAQAWRDRFAADPGSLEIFRAFKQRLIAAKDGAATYGFKLGDLYLMADDGKNFVFVVDGFEWYESIYPGMIYDVVKYESEYWRGYLQTGPGYYTNPMYYRYGLLPKLDVDEWGTWFTIWKAIKVGPHYSVYSIDFDAAAVNDMMWRIGVVVITVSLLLLLVIILIAVYLSRAISTPISYLVDGTEAVIREDFSHVVPDTNSPEFKKPIEVFNRMIKRLKELRELEVSYQALKELDEMKDNFLSMVSHDLRTPMTSIKGYASILKKKGDRLSPDERAEYLSIIVNESNRLTRLINDLLDLQRLEQGRMVLNLVPLDLAKLAATSIDSFQGAAMEKKIDLTLSSSPAPAVTADEDRMSQVVANLLSNAIKFTPEGGAVEVMVETVSGEKGTGVKVSVRDSGIGIPADQIGSLFSRFQQVKSLTRDKNQGSGLGLALVRELIQHFGGDAGVESEVGKGSVFHFTIWTTPAGRGDNA